MQASLEATKAYRDQCDIGLRRPTFVFSSVLYKLRPERAFVPLQLMMGYAMTYVARRRRWSGYGVRSTSRSRCTTSGSGPCF